LAGIIVQRRDEIERERERIVDYGARNNGGANHNRRNDRERRPRSAGSTADNGESPGANVAMAAMVSFVNVHALVSNARKRQSVSAKYAPARPFAAPGGSRHAD